MEESTFKGIVMRSTGSWYSVRPSESTEGSAVESAAESIVECTIRGKFRLQGKDTTNPVAVGDWVDFRKNEDGSGIITHIYERQSKLSRRAAGRRARIEHVIVANVDMAWCVQSVATPRFNAGFVDRFLVMAEIEELSAGIIINKADLLDDELAPEIEFWKDLYEDIGYPVYVVSAETHEGLEDFKLALKDQIHVFSGPSGVGKSSLLNEIEPTLSIRTGEVSERTTKGKHTTTNAALHPLSFGGYIADTPGLREFGIWDLEPEDLCSFFIEMRPFLNDCQYHNCTHDHEPKCAVRQAAEKGEMSLERYYSYLNILASLRLGKADMGR